MSVKYITAAEAERLRREALAYYGSTQLAPVEKLRMSGVLGVRQTEYYIVSDGDPRLQSPDPVCDTEPSK